MKAQAMATDKSRTRTQLFGVTTLSLVLVLAGWSLASAQEDIVKTHGYSFFGDLKYPADYPHLNYVNPDAPKGGEISIWAPGTFDSFNPFTRKGRAGGLSGNEFEDMLVTFADDPTASYCMLCETMEYPKSLDWVIFNLRPEVKFSDGTPMTAEDVKFTFDLFMEQGLPSFRSAFGSMIGDVEVLGPNRIKYTFTPDSPPRDRIGLAGIIGPFSKKWFEENEARIDESALTLGPGTGPYLRADYDFNQRIVYERDPNYWGNDLAQNIGRNNFDKIRIEYFADSNAAFEGFKAGAYTFRSESSSKQWATGYDFPALEAGHVKKVELPNGNLATGQSFVFNLRRDQFQDIRVREAIGLMFNFEWSNETLFYGLYARTDSFWGNSDLMAVDTPTEGELAVLSPLVDQGLLDASILTDVAILPPVSGARQLDRRAMRRASQLLDEAGWEVGDDGQRRKDGKTLDVEILESSAQFDRIINPFVENMQRLGINAKLDRVDPAQETDRARSYDFDLTTHSFNLGFEPSTGLKQWFGSEAVNESSRNLMGVADPAVDAIIDHIVNADTSTDMKNGVRAMDRVLRAKQFWIPQWFKDVHTVAYYDMYEHPELPPLARGELDFWWYNADKAAALRAAGVFQ